MIGGMLTPTRFSSALDVDLLSTLFFNYLQFIYFKRGCPGLEKRVCYLFGFFFGFFPWKQRHSWLCGVLQLISVQVSLWTQLVQFLGNKKKKKKTILIPENSFNSPNFLQSLA